jgi:FkbM family methyltransferase
MSVLKKVINKYRTFKQHSKLFDGPWEVAKYLYLRICPLHLPKIVRVRLRMLKHPLGCRPCTTDLVTLMSTFNMLYHRPPTALPEDAVILDLGSNVGFTIVEMASTFPSARIIGVEMDEENFRLASENIKPFGSRCKVIHAAVWTEDCHVSYEGKESDAFRIKSSSESDGQQVVSKTIESLEREYGLTRVDYLKMDIEGAETDIMKSSIKWADMVQSMKIEIHRDGDMAVIMAKLEQAGYQCSPCNLHWSTIIATRNPKRIMIQ